MQTRFKNLFVSVLVALGLTFMLTVSSRAQTPASDASSTATVQSAEPEGKPQATAAAEPEETTLVAEVEKQVADEAKMRRLDEPVVEPETTETVVGSDKSVAGEVEEALAVDAKSELVTDDQTPKPVKRIKHRRHGDPNELPLGNHAVPVGVMVNDMVSIAGSSVLDGESRGDVVSIAGNTTINGKAGGDAVSVVGNTTINGQARRAVVSVVGNTMVNGEVGQEVVTVLGNVTLGPKAVVHGDIVTVGGQLHRDPGAVVHGSVQEINFLGRDVDFSWLQTWARHCAVLGRPLAFHSGLGWAWALAGSVFALYVLLALLFPRAFEKCAETLEQRPGYSLLAVVLTVLITPVLVVLLAATGVGVILIPFVAVGLLGASIFGKAVMHAWLGRRITKYFGDGPMKHVAVATLIGSVLLLLLYTVPFLGFFLWKVLDVIGTGVVVYTLMLSMRRERPVAPPPVATAGMEAGMAAATADMRPPPVAAGDSGVTGMAAEAASVPPVLPVTSLPRAGFWARIAASLLDAIVVGVAAGLTHTGSWFLLIYFAYCVTLWALKGTTIGGIVCGIKVARLDDSKVDWTVAIVRGLGGFLSLAVIGLGFVWVAFDDEKQSWHDKIAGTILVRMPKGVSLL